MANDLYKLQVPISKDLEFKLKALADDEERTLRVFCRRVLQSYVENCGFEFPENKPIEPKIEVNNNESVEVEVVEEVRVVPDETEIKHVSQEVVKEEVIEVKKPKLGKLQPPKA